MNKELIKVACYCRVSTKSEEQEQSFEAQQEYFKEKLSKKNGYELVKIYADKGVSGTDLNNRVQFNNMLRSCGIIKKEVKARPNEIRKEYISVDYVVDTTIEPKFNLIYVKDSSRLARNTEISRIISRLRDNKVYVYFEDLNKSTENPSEKMLIDFMFSMSEQESISRSNKVRFGNNQTAKQGVIRNMKLYGYTYNKEEKTLRVVEEEAKVVKLIFKLRLEGHGARGIARILKEKGIKNRKGNEWRYNTINGMLQNPTYTGKVVRNRWYSSRMYGKDIVKLNSPEKWIVKESDNVDKIISEEDFEIVQNLIDKNRNKVGKQRGKYVGVGELAGKIVCSNCGKYYTKNVDRGRVFYNCSNKKQNGVKACNAKNLRKIDLDMALEEYLDIEKHFDYVNTKIDLYVGEFESYKSKINNMEISKERVEELENKIRIEKDKYDKILSLYLEDNSETIVGLFNEKKAIIENNILTLEKELEKLLKPASERKAILDRIDKNIKMLKSIPEIMKGKRAMTREESISEGLAEIRVDSQGKPHIVSVVDILFMYIENDMKKIYLTM